jgi:hypothetical protein
MFTPKSKVPPPSLLKSDAPPNVETPPEAPAPPTVNQLLATAEQARAAAVVAPAQAFLAAFVPRATAGSALHRKMAAEAAPILKRAREVDTAKLAALGCRLTQTSERFDAARAEVGGWADAADVVDRTIAKIGTLTPRDCERTEGDRQLNRQSPTVERMRVKLHMCGAGEDLLRAHLDTLTETLEALETWARSYAATPQPAPDRIQAPRRDDGPQPSQTYFSPFDYPKR